MTTPPNSFFRVEKDNGVLYLTIGYIQTQDGPGWFDQAVLYCPFCGQKIQDKEEIARRSNPIHPVERTASQPTSRVGLFERLRRLARGRSP